MLRTIAHRFRQFYHAIFCRYGKADELFARAYLNSQEIALFNQLPGFEKKHCVEVAKIMLELALYNPELDPRKLVRLGLLHDIGKSAERSGPVTKAILVVLRYLCPGIFDRLADQGENRGFLNKFYVYKHHGDIGAKLLAKMGESAEIVSIIRKHDPLVEPLQPEDPLELKILQQADAGSRG